MILLDRRHLGLADLAVERNAYGRQVASFEADVELPGESDALPRRLHPRAARPRGRRRRRGARGARRGARAAARRDVLVAAFHPELTDDPRVHGRFLELVTEAMSVRA